MATKISAMFNALAQKFLEFKSEEKARVESRRNVGQDIIGLPEFQENKKEKGTVTLKSDAYEISIEYTQSEVRDMEAISKALPQEALKRIFPPKPMFTQSGLNAYLKELQGAMVYDAKAKALYLKIKKVLEENTKTQPGSPQITVKRVEAEA